MAGRPALQRREPGQVRKEAATAIHCKCRGNGSPPLLFVVQIDLILYCSPAPTLTYVHVRCALSPARAASQADLVTNSPRSDRALDARSDGIWTSTPTKRSTT